MHAIHVRFGLPGRLPEAIEKQIKQADQVAAFYEATRLAGFEPAEARRFFGSPDRIPTALANELVRLTPDPTEIAQSNFLSRFRDLQAAVDDAHPKPR